MWWIAIIMLIFTALLIDGARMVRNPSRNSRAGPLRCCCAVLVFVLTKITYPWRLKSKFRMIVFDTLRFIQKIASPNTIKVGLDVVVFIFNTIIWRGTTGKSEYVLIPVENTSFVRALRMCTKESRMNDIKICVLYFHGGGYFCGNEKLYYPAHMEWLKESGPSMEIVSVEYALSNHELALKQCWGALMWYRRLYPRRKIILAGDSAGGCIAIRLAMKERPPVEGLVLISPWVVQDTRASSFHRNRNSDYITTEFVQIASSLHGLKLTDPVVSPLFCPLGAFQNLPRTLLVWGEAELFRDDIMSFASRLTREGVPVSISRGTNKPHIWPLLYPWLYQNDAVETLREIASFCLLALRDS
jgi:acetyl esterase/lipase